MAIFAAVVERRSMRAAATQLGLTPSAVSQHLRALERELDMVLLHRTTRKLTLTEAGARYYEGCAAMVRAARLADESLAELRDELVGELRIAAPAGFVGPALSEPLAPLMSAHPRLRVTLVLHDESIDLVDNRIDLAIRAGHQDSPTHVARPLAEWRSVICASPAYLQTYGNPESPEGLLALDWLMHGREPRVLELTGPDGQARPVKVQPRLLANSMPAVREFALAGLGVAVQPEPEIRELLASGRLVRVLPDWSAASLPVYAVTPRRDAQPAKVRAAIEAFRRYLAT